VRRMVFDKTGTLTRGRMSVVAMAVAPAAGMTERQLVTLAAAVEQNSGHPLAHAILVACEDPIPPVTESRVLPGLGVSARLAGDENRLAMVGSMRFLGIDALSPLAALAQEHSELGETIAWVGWSDATVAGLLALRDVANPTAAEALRALHHMGIETALLSGDSEPATRTVATELGLTHYEGNLTPAEKAERMRAWQDAGAKVGMIGDGVNDAPALAQADLSITVAGGTDVAGETSDMLLTRDDLSLIPRFIRLSQRTRRTIGENLGWAFAYNLITVPLAVAGLVSPAIAAVAMAGSSLLVVGNSMRLRQ
jgi:P-type Cu+ transporter